MGKGNVKMRSLLHSSSRLNTPIVRPTSARQAARHHVWTEAAAATAAAAWAVSSGERCCPSARASGATWRSARCPKMRTTSSRGSWLGCIL